MMRTIIFRGKRIYRDNGTDFVYGFYVYNKILKQHRINTPSGGSAEVSPATVGQFTGLLDKEGKDIYEGDIVEYDSAKNEYGGKLFVNMVCWDYARSQWALSPYSRPYYLGEEMRVIGNVTDHSELLEKSK